MPIIFNKDEKTAMDTESGASLSLLETRRETQRYLLKTGEDTFWLDILFSFVVKERFKWSVPPIKKNISILYLTRAVDLDSGELLPQNIDYVDYRLYKLVIESLLKVYLTEGDPEWPTQIVVDFSAVDKFQRKKGVGQ